jgi:hypothetical protein
LSPQQENRIPVYSGSDRRKAGARKEIGYYAITGGGGGVKGGVLSAARLVVPPGVVPQGAYSQKEKNMALEVGSAMQEPTVTNQLGELYKELDMVRNRVVDLKKALSPVLRPDEPASPNVSKDRPVLFCPLLENINELMVVARQVNDLVSEIHIKLQL